MLKRLLLFVPLVFFVACGSLVGEIDSSDVNAVIQTLTATMWTATPSTPSATAEPRTGKIVDSLNNAMMGTDPLAETIGKKFSVVDAQVITEPPNNLSGILRINVECEWIYSDSCTPEESFVALMHAFRSNDKVRERIAENVPVTVHTLQMVSFNHMNQEGMIVVMWQDVMDYMNEKINGNQLGARIVRMVTP
jgi:hypothetical protein